ncbi:hypothetical protein A2_00100 [Pseudomonas phage BIM BV-45]|nr:hypothetical protein A2_00100 [Pseudomonas phage BIM BV-45]
MSSSLQQAFPIGRKVKHSRRGNAIGIVDSYNPNGRLVRVRWAGSESRTNNDPIYLTLLPEDKPVIAADLNNLTANQKNILADLLRQVRATSPGQIVAGRRTDAAARTVGVDNKTYAHECLGLRAAGLITSTNDGKEFVLWNFTNDGYMKAVELANVQAKKPETWLVWCPTSNKPPQVKHSCEQEAMAVAESMARSYPGQLFHAVQVHAGFQLKTERVKVEKFEDKRTMVQV